MKRVVVYAGTRNLYRNMTTAVKSLLSHTHIDRVWFLIEDDDFPEPLPDVIRTMNVADQKWFNKDGPNINCHWTYMSLIRLAIPFILQKEDRALWLDVDTIVNADIGELFDTDMEGCYMAAAKEPLRTKYPLIYCNTGVLLMDLDKLSDGKASELIRLVNGHKLDLPDQDAINIRCQGQIKLIGPEWNSGDWTENVSDPKIIHYMADREYWRREGFAKYENAEWKVI